MKYTNLDWGITQIDTGLHRPDLAACYLLQEGDNAVLIETGTARNVDFILSVLAQKGIAREQLDYVIPTHIHLDHAGGVGPLMQLLPNAQLVVHPYGAKHMADPAKLQAGATAVYGEETYQAVYGDLLPVAEERIIVADDGFSLDLSGRRLDFIDTPGHARHHFCVHDAKSEGIFTGDTFGLAYPELTVAGRAFLFPTTTPVQFDPEALKHSIRRLMSLQPKRVFLTHFGQLDAPADYVDSLLSQIDDYVALAHKHRTTPDRETALTQALSDYILARVQAHGCEPSLEESMALLAMDIGLNAQGIDVWLSRQE